MRKIFWYGTAKWLFAALLAVLMLEAAWAQTPSPPASAPPAAATTPASPTENATEPANKVVLKVGDQQFTKAEMDQLFGNLAPQMQRAVATQGKKPLGERYALSVALSQQAERNHLDQTPAFLRNLAIQKQQMEAQAVFEQINQQANVTPEEIQQYYTAHSPEFEEITARQFVVRKKTATFQNGPGQTAASTGSGLPPQEALTRAQAIRKEVVAGTDIKQVMEKFKAPGDIIIESEPRTIRRGGMRPDLEKVAFALKDGEVSQPIDLPQVVIFFQVIKHSPSTLTDVTPDIEKKLHQQKVEAALGEIKKNAAVWMDEEYFAPPSKAAVPTLKPALGSPKP